MLRLSKLTDYAVVVLVRLSGMEGVQTSPGIAAATGIPEPTVAKVLKTLAAGDLVASQRGAKGGYRLNRHLAAIPIADVIAAIDGPIALTACVDGSASGCESQGLCPMRGRWDPVNDAIHTGVVRDHPGRHAERAATGVPRRQRSAPAVHQPSLAVRIPVRRRIGFFMAAATETLDTVQSVTQSGYKWGFETTSRWISRPRG